MPTRVACKHCNAKRVRCDRAVSGDPCSNCRPLKIPCELIESKRGKYKRSITARRLEHPRQADVPLAESVEHSMSPQILDPPSDKGNAQRAMGARRFVSPSLPDLIFDKGSGHAKVVYMGDSSNMKYLVEELGDPFVNSTDKTLWGEHLHRSLTQRLGAATQTALRDIRREEIDRLRDIGALDALDIRLSDDLIGVFFDHSFPFFPIFDKEDFLEVHRAGRSSLLILNAVYSMAAIHCSDSLVERLGFNSRYTACSTFYRRAKALHESNYESDGITNIQALILLMNWWETPMEQKDTWHWLSVATNLAQALGMHRAKSYSILTHERQKLWRRIWWVLYTHDIHHAAVFGRPPHVHSQYVDLPPPTKQDLEQFASENALTNELAHFHHHLFRLASLVHRCLESKFSISRNQEPEREAHEEFLQYPAENVAYFSRPDSPVTIAKGYYPSIIRLIYSDYVIVMQRMLAQAQPTNGKSSFSTAGEINQVLEDLLSAPSDVITRLPFISFPAIFCSILVYIISIRKENSRIAVLAEHRARLAMIVLDQLQDRWPVVVWTRYLLATMLDNRSTSTTTRSYPSNYMWPREFSGASDFDGAQTRERVSEAMVGMQSPAVTASCSSDNVSASPFEIRNTQNGSVDHEWIDNINFSQLPLLFPGNDMLGEDTFGYEAWFTTQDFDHYA